jgi:hypothetical protein
MHADVMLLDAFMVHAFIPSLHAAATISPRQRPLPRLTIYKYMTNVLSQSMRADRMQSLLHTSTAPSANICVLVFFVRSSRPGASKPRAAKGTEYSSDQKGSTIQIQDKGGADCREPIYQRQATTAQRKGATVAQAVCQAHPRSRHTVAHVSGLKTYSIACRACWLSTWLKIPEFSAG